jgi:hypothetical protein
MEPIDIINGCVAQEVAQQSDSLFLEESLLPQR